MTTPPAWAQSLRDRSAQVESRRTQPLQEIEQRSIDTNLARSTQPITQQAWYRSHTAHLNATSLLHDQLMHTEQPNNPLHGITLEAIVTELAAHYGWPRLGELIPINCFLSAPSVRSSLTFLRRTAWARARVEALYLDTFHR